MNDLCNAQLGIAADEMFYATNGFGNALGLSWECPLYIQEEVST